MDPYVIVSIKENRKQRTRTLSNNNHPTWNETITTIVNDPDQQSITFKLMDDDVGSFDSVRLPWTPCSCSTQPAVRTQWLRTAAFAEHAASQLALPRLSQPG